MQIHRVGDPDDPAIRAFGALQEGVYFEPQMLIPAGYIGQMLGERMPGTQAGSGPRRDVLLVAREDGAAPDAPLLGGSLFHYLPEAQAGFGSFMGVALSARGRGVARGLHEARWQTLLELSGGGCRALFIDVVNPGRESEEQRRQEREAGSDALERRRAFQRLGFRTVDLRYQQPVGGPGGGPVTDLDLLAFLPGWPGRVETALVLATMRAYWSPWLGAAGTERALRELNGRAGGRDWLELLPAWEGPRPG